MTMRPQLPLHTLSIILFIVLVSSSTAGPTLEQVIGGNGKEFEHSPLVLLVKVMKIIKEPHTIESGYLSNDDVGPYIKTKIRIIFADCVVIKVLKNDTTVGKRITAKIGDEFMATFQEQVEGPPKTRCYVEDYEKPPKVNGVYRFFFLDNSIRELRDIRETMDIKNASIRPSFVRPSKP
jgi:hypothetical protein